MALTAFKMWCRSIFRPTPEEERAERERLERRGRDIRRRSDALRDKIEKLRGDWAP